MMPIALTSIWSIVYNNLESTLIYIMNVSSIVLFVYIVASVEDCMELQWWLVGLPLMLQQFAITFWALKTPFAFIIWNIFQSLSRISHLWTLWNIIACCSPIMFFFQCCCGHVWCGSNVHSHHTFFAYKLGSTFDDGGVWCLLQRCDFYGFHAHY